jgi:trk system potassium uptake protein TrkA
VAEVDVRNRYNVNILGVKLGDEIEPLLNADYAFAAGTHLIVAGDKRDSLRLMDKV